MTERMAQVASAPRRKLGPVVLTVNGGSSSVKLALFSCTDPPRRLLTGLLDRVGGPQASLTLGAPGQRSERTVLAATSDEETAARVIEVLDREIGPAAIQAVGHRIVHGGARLVEHQAITPALLEELRRNQALDPDHLPREIALIEALTRWLPDRPAVACFDSAFHAALPRVAQLLPIPREHSDAGVRRLGFHGLSYTYLLDELRRLGGAGAAHGRVVLAHLGAGASMAAVRDGQPVDTTMSFTAAGGLVMGTRPGDLDPGLLLYLMRAGGLDAQGVDDLINRRCGLLGVSQTSADMRELLGRRAEDPRAAEAVALFCYQARKWIGALSAALGGLDTLVFSGGIGERAGSVRAEICSGLGFLGIDFDAGRNLNDDGVISADGSGVTVRVIRTDEEIVIARIVLRLRQAAADR